VKARRLLILCYFYPPLAGGGVHRVLGFTRHLPARGWSCTVVCAGEEDFWMRDESLEQRVPADVEVIRVRGSGALAAWLKVKRGPGRPPGPWTDRLRRAVDWWMIPDAYEGWARRAGVAAIRAHEARAFDVVLSTSPPDSVHLAALAFERRFRIPWAADFRDPWMGLSFRRPPTAWHRSRHRALERQVLASADLVMAASQTHARELERRAAEDGIRRVVHLPNGFESDVTGESEAPPSRARETTSDDPGSRASSLPVAPRGGSSRSRGAWAAESSGDAGIFRVAFTGTLFRTPDTGMFLDALHDFLGRRAEARRRVRVSFLGPFDPGDADRAVALGLSGIVSFDGPRPHREARELQHRAHLLLLWKPTGTSGRVPGRVYEYFEAERPLLAVLDPADETADIVRRGGGIVIASGDRAGIEREIERHYQAWQRGEPLEARRPQWLDEHDRARLAERLATWLDDLVETRP
jgi:glycosyltransferase involved in cell wall biosynthesis